MRLVTFNVNGINNVLNYMPWCEDKSFEYMFKLMMADVVCFQETKIQQRDLTAMMAKVPGYDAYFTFPKVKRGYSGVAIYVSNRIPVYKAEEGLTGRLTNHRGVAYQDVDGGSIGGYPAIEDLKTALLIDSEGRCLVLDLGWCVVIGLYCPANTSDNRDDFRQLFYQALDTRIRNLIALGREVVVLGDINIARDLMDSADGQQALLKQAKLVRPSNDAEFVTANARQVQAWKETGLRRMLDDWVVELDMQDTTRQQFPNRLDMYTCWNVKLGARAGNFGSRIDYILATKGLKCTGADIRPDYLGSDHCPVYADLVPGEEDNNNNNAAQTVKAPRLCAKYLFSSQTIHAMFANAKKRSRPVEKDVGSATTTAQAIPDVKSRDETVASKTKSAPLAPTPVAKKRSTAAAPQKSLLNYFNKSNACSTDAESSLTLAHDNDTKSGRFEDLKHDAKNITPRIPGGRQLASGKQVGAAVQGEDKEELGVNNATGSAAAASAAESADANVVGASASASAFLNTETGTTKAWNDIFKPPKPPLCNVHQEPCKLMTTKKSGANKGRSFWVCSRPVGIEQSSIGQESKCNFFKWCK